MRGLRGGERVNSLLCARLFPRGCGRAASFFSPRSSLLNNSLAAQLISEAALLLLPSLSLSITAIPCFASLLLPSLCLSTFMRAFLERRRDNIVFCEGYYIHSLHGLSGKFACEMRDCLVNLWVNCRVGWGFVCESFSPSLLFRLGSYYNNALFFSVRVLLRVLRFSPYTFY